MAAECLATIHVDDLDSWRHVVGTMLVLTAVSLLVGGLLFLWSYRQELRRLTNLRQPRGDIDAGDLSIDDLTTSGQLMFEGPKWRLRSVRRLTFLSPNVVRAHYSLDFKIPDGLVGSVVYVPLLMTEKVKLASVDLTDETGRSIPILNLDDEHNLEALLLLALWAQFFPGVAIGIGSEEEQLLLNIVRCPDRQVSQADLYRLAARLAARRRASAATDQGSDANFLEFFSVVSRFVDHGHLYAVLQDAQPRQRRILKLSFVADAPWQFPSVTQTLRNFVVRLRAPVDLIARRAVETVQRDPILREIGVGRTTLARAGLALGPGRQPGPYFGLAKDIVGLTRSGLSRVGVTSRKYNGTFSPLRARSEHLEVEAPPGTYFAGGALLVGNERREAVRRGSDVAHFYSKDSDPQERRFEVRLRARRRGWLLAAGVVTSTITLLVHFAWYRRYEIGNSPQLAAGVVSVALGFGAAAIAYLVRPGEHPMTTRLLEGPRLAATTAGAAALLSMVLLAVGSGRSDGSVWQRVSFVRDGTIPLAMVRVATLVVASNYVGSAIGWIKGLRRRLAGRDELSL